MERDRSCKLKKDRAKHLHPEVLHGKHKNIVFCLEYVDYKMHLASIRSHICETFPANSPLRRRNLFSHLEYVNHYLVSAESLV